jgi:hypothetical protein
MKPACEGGRNVSEQTAPEAGYPAQLSATDRLAEIAEILAAGLKRLWARKSSRISADLGESSLDLPDTESGHSTSAGRRIADG